MPTTRTADGVSIEYDDVGEGPAVLLVHGITEQRRGWDPIIDRISGGHRVVALDLRGHGASGAGPTYDLEALAGDVIAVAADAGLDRPHLVGHSLGGAVVSIVGAGYPVASVVNVDQPLELAAFQDQLKEIEPMLRDPESFAPVMAQLFATITGDVLDPVERQRVESLRRPDQDVVLGIWRVIFESPREELEATVDAALAGYDVPYLSLFGIDPGPDYVDWLGQRIPGAQVEIWEGVGHYPHLHRPDDFVSLISNFWT